MSRRIAALGTVILLLLVLIPNLLNDTVLSSGVELSNRFDELSDSGVSDTATHLIGFSINDTSTPLGSIEVQYCSNNPLTGEPCTAPTGFDVSGAVLAAQTGNTGFSISSLTTANDLILSQSTPLPAPLISGPNTYQLNNVINPSSSGTYYIRLYIYPTTDASGTPTEVGGIAFAINGGVNVSSIVPPYLEFCVAVVIYNNDCSTATNYLLNFGSLSDQQSAFATSQMLVGTNANNGYNISVTGTTLTSGNQTISSTAVPSPSIIGTNQFGMNLIANTSPSVGNDPAGLSSATIASGYNVMNQFSFNDNSLVASYNAPSYPVTFTSSYVTNVSKDQTPGVYSTTLSYICLANF